LVLFKKLKLLNILKNKIIFNNFKCFIIYIYIYIYVFIYLFMYVFMYLLYLCLTFNDIINETISGKIILPMVIIDNPSPDENNVTDNDDNFS